MLPPPRLDIGATDSHILGFVPSRIAAAPEVGLTFQSDGKKYIDAWDAKQLNTKRSTAKSYKAFDIYLPRQIEIDAH